MSNMSHENCTHDNSKAGRAKCRRNRAKFTDAFAAVLSEAIETPAPVFEPVRVTADNWREHREDRVRIWVQIDDETESEVASGVRVTGWGKQWVNYASPIGKTKRVAITALRVETLPPVE